jgi:hypothetical protein
MRKPARADIGRAALIALSELYRTNPDEGAGRALRTSIVNILAELGFDRDLSTAAYQRTLDDGSDARTYWLRAKRFFDRRRA